VKIRGNDVLLEAPAVPQGGDIVLALDPGTYKTGWVLYDMRTSRIVEKDDGQPILTQAVTKQMGVTDNEKLLELLRVSTFPIVCEMVGHYGTGMSVGKTVFETCIWIGRFKEACKAQDFTTVLRKTGVTYMCGSSKAKDTNVKQALWDLDRFGGNELKAVGGKKCPKCKGKGWCGAGRPTCTECDGAKWEWPPGPLYGVISHMLPALCCAVWYQDQIWRAQRGS
jgi:hypothetical protein